MPIETLFISGPPQSGKSTVARLIAERVIERPIHHLRMRKATDDHTNAIMRTKPSQTESIGKEWASTHEVIYTKERIFETLPDGLRAVRTLDHTGFAVIEADSDPTLRHAYPHDYRAFVMPSPGDVHEVFRTPADAAVALQQVMQDTASFASEIFGLFDAAGLDDSAGVSHSKSRANAAAGQAVEQLDIAENQLRQFLSSPIGAEIASRIQLQPEFHALVESDVVVINTGLGCASDALDDCTQRLEKLLARVRQDARRRSVLYWGDLMECRDPTNCKLVRRFRDLFKQ